MLIIFLWRTPPSEGFDDFKSEINTNHKLENVIEDVQYEQCDWIKSILEHGPDLSKTLPEPGQQRPGGNMFWLKKPLKHTKVSFKSIPTFSSNHIQYFSNQLKKDGSVEMMILKYNVYNPKWTQHTEKYSNTVKILSETTLTPLSLFPKLYGSCNDVDGFHTVAVEYIPFEFEDLPPPKTLVRCVQRADLALSLFEELHGLDLVLVDMKKGQWMSRGEKGGVLQDIDDIVKNGNKGPYEDQIKWFKTDLRQHGVVDVEKLWEKMFPGGLLDLKYNVIGVDLLLSNLGFRWREKECSELTRTFEKCFGELMKWTRQVPFDLPSFKQVRRGLRICFETRKESETTDFKSLLRSV